MQLIRSVFESRALDTDIINNTQTRACVCIDLGRSPNLAEVNFALHPFGSEKISTTGNIRVKDVNCWLCTKFWNLNNTNYKKLALKNVLFNQFKMQREAWMRFLGIHIFSMTSSLRCDLSITYLPNSPKTYIYTYVYIFIYKSIACIARKIRKNREKTTNAFFFS